MMTSRLDIFASAIIYYSRNNQDVVHEHLGDIHKQLASSFRSFEIIIVNNTAYNVAPEQFETYENVTILNLSYVHGREQAMTAGADLAIGDFLFEFDYMPTRLPEGILREMQNTAFNECADIVVAMNASSSKWTSRLFYYILRKCNITDVPMGTDLIRLISRRALNSILQERRSFRFRKLLYARSGYKNTALINENLSVFSEKEPKARLALATDVLTSFSRMGSSVARWLAAIFLLVTLSIAVYAVVIKLSGLPIAEGWTTLMVFLCMAFSGVFIILSVIARTVELILLELQHTKPYRVRDITPIGN